MYTTVPLPALLFLYLPDITSATSVTFSARFDTEAQLLASLRGSSRVKVDSKLEALSERLESLRHLSSRLTDIKDISGLEKESKLIKAVSKDAQSYDDEEDDDEDHPKKTKIMDVVKGLLPKKREPRVPLKEGEIAPKKPEAKTVSHIQKKHKK